MEKEEFVRNPHDLTEEEEKRLQYAVEDGRLDPSDGSFLMHSPLRARKWLEENDVDPESPDENNKQEGYDPY